MALSPCLLYLAPVLTMDPAAPEADRLAVRDGRVVAEAPDCAPTPLEGLILPGFLDLHAHPAEAGRDLQLADLSTAGDEAELLAITTAWAAENPDAAWIEGAGWDPSRLDGLHPRAALDAAFPDRPVFLASADGHSAFVNSRALALAALRESPPGGVVEQGPDGPDGRIRETAVDLVAEHIPEPTRAQLDEAVARAARVLLSHGITGVVDAAPSRAALRAYARADRGGRLELRIFGAWPVGDPAEVGIRRRWSPRVEVGAVKVYLDGVIEAKTARLLQPYPDGSNGPLQLDDARLDRILAAAHRRGLRLHAHVIGDAAVRQLLDAVERQPIPTLAAHVQLVDPADRPRFAKLGVYPDIQALWAFPDPIMRELTLPVVGAAVNYPFRSMQAAGATLVAGSDWDVSTANPWPAIEVALTRRDPDAGGEALHPEEALDLDTMLRAYTSAAAEALGHPELGRLRPGHPADFVLVDRDPRKIPVEALSELRVLGTWTGGRRVYAADGG